MGKVKEICQRIENGYLATDLIVAFIFYIAFKKGDAIYIFFAFGVACLMGLTTMLHHGTKVINNYDGDIFAKDEDSDAVYIVKSGGFKNHVDGIKVNGKVYKLPAGVRATVTRNGNIYMCSLLGEIIYSVAGGELQKAPDACWNKLFSKKTQEA